MASGGQHGLAQSLFQVGGNAGSALGPLLAAFIVLPRGQSSIAWFSLAALLAIIVLANVGAWSKKHRAAKAKSPAAHTDHRPALSSRKVVLSVAILIALVFSKYFYLASLITYYTFYLIQKFHVSVQNAQVHLFVFLGAVAAGTIIGGPIGDRFGRKYVIWGSILGVLPFTLLLPYANLFWTGILSVVIGLILASAFSAILVYAQDLIPRKGRHDLRPLFRPGLRHGRRRRSPARRISRPHQHRFRLQSLRLPPGNRPADRIPAQPGEGTYETVSSMNL
jgi:FSR family fosmidomycin resistance protein-like MFS transporter